VAGPDGVSTGPTCRRDGCTASLFADAVYVGTGRGLYVPMNEAAVGWSHTCNWVDLAMLAVVPEAGAAGLVIDSGWPGRWTASFRTSAGEMTAPVRALGALPVSECVPVRKFSWARSQRHRCGLQYMVSTGRHHGFESLAEARLLMMLDFAGGVVEVLSQPMRLRFVAEDGSREHIPDFLAETESGRWLIDVRPAERIRPRDEVAFAAASQVAGLMGWGYAVVSGWRQPAMATVDTLSSQRRALADPLRTIDALKSTAAAGDCRFDELVAATRAPAIARAFLLHLLWRRELGIDLARPLQDQSVVALAADAVRRAG
jgi:hypothetical protein